MLIHMIHVCILGADIVWGKCMETKSENQMFVMSLGVLLFEPLNDTIMVTFFRNPNNLILFHREVTKEEKEGSGSLQT